MSLDFLKNLGYNVYEKGRLNILGVRRKPFKVNCFNDDIYLFWKDGDIWEKRRYQATTLPGKHWLTTLMNKKGTAILKPGQYINAFRLGKHKGEDALVQCRPVTVYRDADLDEEFDYGNEETGLFGINIHRAHTFSHFVNSWSAGCQVIQRPADFSSFINICKDRAGLSNQVFTYTLIEEII